MLRGIGADTGSANVGAGMVEGDPTRGLSTFRCIFARYIGTTKAGQKLRRKIRVSTDDRRRLNEITDAFGEILRLNAPDAFAVEWYQPTRQRSKDGWKAALTAAGLITLGRERKVTTFELLPFDKRKQTGMAQPTEEDYDAWLREHIQGYAEAIEEIAPSNRSHPMDGVLLAIAGIFELHERRLEGVK